VPNRWVIVRRLDKGSIDPPNAPIPTVEAWVVLSDFVRNLDDFDNPSASSATQTGPRPVDLEVDVSPFIDVNPQNVSDSNAQLLDGQAEVFLGRKIKLGDWDKSEFDNFRNTRLNVMSSSNPLFPDFTHHNMNVFSVLDNFEYPDPDNKNQTLHLHSAKADYFVLGFHSDEADDPMTTTPDPNPNPNTKPTTNSDRLKSCNMVLKDGTSTDAKTWLNQPAEARLVCHAAMYDVQYDRTKNPRKPPVKQLADDAALKLKEKQPIAVGATTTDALLAYCRSHQDRDTATMMEIEKDLIKIEALLRGKEDDDVDGLQAAADESLELAFQKFDSGTLWKFKEYTNPSDPPGVATQKQKDDLAALNAIQECLESLNRKISKTSWSLFAEWWNWVSNYFSDPAFTRTRVDKLVNSLSAMGISQHQLGILRDAAVKASPSLAKATPDRFFERKDPTLLFGSIRKGWDADFTEKLQVRLDTQIMVALTDNIAGWEGGSSIFDSIRDNKRLPTALREPIRDLLSEFLNLRSANSTNTLSPTFPNVVPWYHDEKSRTPGNGSTSDQGRPYDETRGRDTWSNTQPWQPIYVEWETNYYHIPFDEWGFDEYNRYSHWGATVASYAVKKTLAQGTTAPTYDIRTVKGRNYLIPQGATTLQTMLKQIFQNTNPHQLEEVYKMPATEQKVLLNAISDVDIVSFPLTGLTSQLVTQFEGSHVKPLMKLPGTKSQLIVEARDGFENLMTHSTVADLEKKMLLMDANTNATPYGEIPVGDTDEPYKPVTHGQLIFTKINIVDKFGQVISLDPSLDPPDKKTTITPCISDTYYPGTINQDDPTMPTARPNLIIPQTDNSCPFIALPPSINQPARLNAQFLLRDSTTQTWRSCTDWDFAPEQNPIIGWFVVNYADQGLQIFLADGTFYREIRKGGRYKTKDPPKSKTVAAPKWLPFEAPDDLSQKVAAGKVQQLDYLISCMRDGSYLNGFIHMINQAMDPAQEGSTLPHAPKTYATYTSAIVGRPLALVNAGWSLELADEENRNWSAVGEEYPKRRLLKADGSQWPDTQNPQKATLSKETQDGGYYFDMKLGDKDRNYDGLLGYFLPSDGGPAGSSDFDFSKLYTYFTTEPSTNDPRIELNSTNYPITTPYYLDPTTRGPKPTQSSHDQKLRRFGLIMDPFLPVHAYTAILPNKSLQLPPYLVEQVLQNVTAFWRVGPILVPEDVPAFSWGNRLTGAYSGALPTKSNDTIKQPTVPLPIAAPAGAQGGQDASYRFLQPYWASDPTIAPASQVPGTHFNALSISADAASGGDAAEAKLLDGPYTMLEGYLQITKPIAGAGAQS
jgi:hypothetical protein